MNEVVIVGGGWAGCAAAMTAVNNGMAVTLLERTDMLLGTGLVGGIMRNNGRYTAAEEIIAMGGGGLFAVIEQNLKHKNIRFPGHEHVDLYDVGKIQGQVRTFLESIGINMKFERRISSLVKDGDTITGVKDQNNKLYTGDAFIDATGTAGPVANCTKYGNGCAMCILRCPSFGGRISLTALAGIGEMIGQKGDGSIGSMSGSCKILKESLAPWIIERLDKEGVVIIPLPDDVMEDHLDIKCCQQYALREFRQNLILLDTGHAKMMTPYYSIRKLRTVPGFENVRYEDPYAGSRGNSMRFFAMAPRDDTLKVKGAENLFCAGEKAGLLVGHTEAIVTGVLAGYNCASYVKKAPLLILPRELASGDAIAYVREEMETEEGIKKKYTFSGAGYFKRMEERGLYSVDADEIKRKVERLGLSNVFGED